MKKPAKTKNSTEWSVGLLLISLILMISFIIDDVSFEYRKQKSLNDFLEQNLQNEKILAEIAKLRPVNYIYQGDTVSLSLIPQSGYAPLMYGVVISSHNNKITYCRGYKSDGTPDDWRIYKKPVITILRLDDRPVDQAKPDITIYREPWKEKRFLKAFRKITQQGSGLACVLG